MKLGLVLEGGGMRGIYTVGVLDRLMEEDIEADYVIGVSAGACNGVSYVSRQKGRAYRVDMDYLDDKRYGGISSFLKTKSIFGMDFLFDEIPNHLDPFDYETFLASPCEFVTGVTDVDTGKTVYFTKEHLDHDSTVIRASSSIPIFAPMVRYRGGKYLDGGTSDPIPVRKALDDGCDKVIVVLTRSRDFVKKPEKFRYVYSRLFRKYPHMIEVLDRRHKVYREEQELVRRLEREGRAIVVAPSRPIEIGRFEREREKLQAVYDMAVEDVNRVMDKIEAWNDER
ncbi:patatin-like phospholipase family protein [Gehongia tenuis]|uniref:Patatin family protein n=1 Tax=Gehongia tenuis TaxID=2763655 RepID=A0A926HPL1_9FIRM|nr:patatin family protein [Gehongia tenuis]MBC8531333.1 patatin family protein [Gehongia tenuis]